MIKFFYLSNWQDFIFLEMALSYQLEVESPEVDFGNSNVMVFNEKFLNFECKYSRTVLANVSISTAETGIEDWTAFGQGQISYDLSVEFGNIGGMTKVIISPNHALPNVGARLKECRISSSLSDEFVVWPIHSFKQGWVSSLLESLNSIGVTIF